MRHLTAAVALAFLLAGCAAYPLPEDMTGIDSDKVANIVRCQMRRAIQDKIIETIRYSSVPVMFGGISPQDLASKLEGDRTYFSKLVWSDFRDKDVRGNLLFYKDVQVSYDFSIEATENNVTGAGANLVRAGALSARNIGLNIENNRTRDVKRMFRVFDSFDSLARLMPEHKCSNTLPTQVNYIYPVTGLIKIQSLVSSFINMNQNNNLGAKDNDYTDAQMSDTITFTTRNTGKVDPGFTHSPLQNVLITSPINLNFDNYREDKYTVIVLLNLPAKRDGLPAFDSIGRTIASKTASTKKIKTAPPGVQTASAHAAASAALDQQRAYNAQEALTQIGTNLGKLSQ